MITLTDSPDPRFETILEEGLAEYNAEKVGGRDWRALAVTVHDPDTGELTVNFHAPEFYARHGWEEFGRIAEAPDMERIFMRKTLGA
jgi:hypothetical protein